MSDIGADLESAWAMVCEAQDRLIKKEGEQAKHHELLSYLYLKYKSDREYAWQTLLRKYSRNPEEKGNVKGAMECTYALSKYLIALERALGERQQEESVSKSSATGDDVKGKASQRPVILVMEDEETAITCLMRSFMSLNVEIMLCKSPLDGVKTLELKLFDFVVSDGRGWSSCYLKAIELYGKEKVVIFSDYLFAIQDAHKYSVPLVRKTISLLDSSSELVEYVAQKLNLVPNP